MDFFKKSCKELCEQLCNNKIKTKDELDKFIKAKCAEYDKKSDTDTESEVIGKEKGHLSGISKALEKQDTVEKLEELQKALEQLGRRTNVKFGSIFLGVGTGTYYREAAKKIKKELKIHVASKGELENLKKQLKEATEKQKKELQEKENLQKELKKITEEKKKQKEELEKQKRELQEKENLQEKLKKITEEKKKQEEELEKQENTSNQKSEEKDRKREDKLKNLIENKDLFRGLPNEENYCYLNTAIQNLYYDKSFSDKVLKTPIPENKKPECKELYAVKVFFLYLAGKITLNHFNSLRKDLAIDLGYNGSQANSLAMQQKLELTCKNQMRLLNQKTPFFDSESYTPDHENIDLNKQIDGWDDGDENVLNSVRIMNKLYEDVSLRQRVLGLDKQDINIKEYDKLLTIINIFNLIADNKLNSQEKDLVEKLGTGQTFSGIKKYVDMTIDAINRSKRSRLLTRDSSMNIWPNNNILNSITYFVNRKTAENNAYHLPLKNNCFTVSFGDREYGKRQNFTLEETLDLESLVNSKKLKIFQKNEEIKTYKFKLISATIGTGGHYYIYRKIREDQWKQFNDSSISDCTWENIKNKISEMCELLTYELV
ncbi:MAG: ubiquitin carboxyl-terminal hydrolase [Clostridia bacterium]|nr:ubiquitin carboxyl-terminal hydrolase [Clostridia bacterium]